MFEWRGKIGLLISARNQVLELDFNRHRPAGISVHTARMKKDQNLVNVDTMINMLDYAEGAVQLLAQAQVDIVVLGCTAASFVRGPAQDLKISESLQKVSGIKSITTSTAVIEALKTMGIKKLSIMTPYIDELNEKENAFFQGNGFEIMALHGMNVEQSMRYPQITPEEIYHFGIEHYYPGSDALFISCTNIRALEAIPYLEMHLGKPVITSNQASIWAALRQIGIKDKLDDCGLLLRNY
jgi:maleate isomerase